MGETCSECKCEDIDKDEVSSKAKSNAPKPILKHPSNRYNDVK